jgi:hypothetical protein
VKGGVTLGLGGRNWCRGLPDTAPHVGEHVLKLGVRAAARPAFSRRAEAYVSAFAVCVEAQTKRCVAFALVDDDLACRWPRHQISLSMSVPPWWEAP